MRAVGVKVLKNKLSEYVRLAASGERILVTDRDRVVAELGPPGPGRAERLSDALLAQAVREGRITTSQEYHAPGLGQAELRRQADRFGRQRLVRRWRTGRTSAEIRDAAGNRVPRVAHRAA